jgi:hypothetical protein
MSHFGSNSPPNVGWRDRAEAGSETTRQGPFEGPAVAAALITDRFEIDDAHLGGERFGGVTDAACSHQVVSTGAGHAAATRTPTFKWFNSALGNIKPSICRNQSHHQHHGCVPPPRRIGIPVQFNRRYDLAAIIPAPSMGQCAHDHDAISPPELG